MDTEICNTSQSTNEPQTENDRNVIHIKPSLRYIKLPVNSLKTV